LSRWKLRFGIKFEKAQGERNSAHAVNAEQWKSIKLPNFYQNICADYICNADETGLFYPATSDGSLNYKHSILSGSKKAVVRVNLPCSSNMSGIE
jgi:hypothetical protein